MFLHGVEAKEKVRVASKVNGISRDEKMASAPGPTSDLLLTFITFSNSIH